MSGSSGQLLQQIGASPWVAVVSVGILIAGLWYYLSSIAPALSAIRDSLLIVAKALRTGAWGAAVSQIREESGLQPNVRAAWEETERRIVVFDLSAETKTYATFGPPRDLWSPSTIVGRTINLPLADAAPNLFVGVGLLFTFLFLTLAIVDATSALDPTKDQGAIGVAMRGLLESAGAKFLTSLTGLLVSIAWTIAFRRRMGQLAALSEEILSAITKFAPPDAAEIMAREQRLSLRALEDLSEDRNALAEENLSEAREQTGTLKRFETDVAVAIARAINAGLVPQFELMTNKLTESIDRLSDRMSSINQEALQKMLEDFAGLLKKATETEMTQLQETLAKLANNLTEAGVLAGTRIEKASESLSESVSSAAEKLQSSVLGLDESSKTFGEAVERLDAVTGNAVELGRAGNEFANRALIDAQGVLDRLQEASERLQQASAGLESLGAAMSEAVEAATHLALDQKEVVEAVKQATPNAMRSISDVLATLQQTVSVTETAMTRTKNAMDTTATALSQTVAQITGGVTDYSTTVANLHGRMDEYLARAIGDLGRKVTSLEEVLEELSEITERLAQARG